LNAQPTILIDVKPDNPAFRNEFFGPVAMFLTKAGVVTGIWPMTAAKAPFTT